MSMSFLFKKRIEPLFHIPDGLQAKSNRDIPWASFPISPVLQAALANKRRETIEAVIAVCREYFKKGYDKLRQKRYDEATFLYRQVGYNVDFQHVARWFEKPGLAKFSFEDALMVDTYNDNMGQLGSVISQAERGLPAGAPCVHCGVSLAKPSIGHYGRCPKCGKSEVFAPTVFYANIIRLMPREYQEKYAKKRDAFLDPLSPKNRHESAWAPQIWELMTVWKNIEKWAAIPAELMIERSQRAAEINLELVQNLTSEQFEKVMTASNEAFEAWLEQLRQVSGK